MPVPRPKVDVVVVGAGIVGLATARALLAERPDLAVTVVDKEPAVGRHQSGHNSGVIHAGLYYKPGSLKARLTLSGRAELTELCAEAGIRHEICGKVVVATEPDELAKLDALAERAAANGVAVTRLGPAGLRDLEPHAAGLAGLHVPSTGIVDFPAVCDLLAAQLVDKGQELRLGTAVTALSEEPGEVVVDTTDGYLSARVLVNCAGLQSDLVANLASAGTTDVRIMPFRGEYYKLAPQRRHLVRNLIYPVPDPRFPFLGVHFSRMVRGGVEAGPNAVPALAREGYSWRAVSRRDLGEIVRAPSTRVLARRYWRTQLGEFHRSLSKRAFVRALQRLVPEVTAADLVRAGAGVRAQAIGPDGALIDDFAVTGTDRMVHVVNAPSPAATASLAIGRHVAALALERLG